MYRFIKTIFAFVIIYTMTLNITSCNNSQNEETSFTDSTLTSATSPTEADLENGRAEIMQQRAMRESFSAEDGNTETVDDPGLNEENSAMNSQNNTSNYRNQKRMINWYCSWCCLIIQKSGEPEGGRCNGSSKNTSYAGQNHKSSNGSTHSWSELSVVGNRKFECSYCGVVIDSKNEPSHGQCCGQDKLPAYHSWHEL
jgi:hypothetical protein